MGSDLTKIAWGAGLGKLIFGQFPNLVFFFLGWSVFALPCYLLTALPLSTTHASEVIFPVVLSGAFLLLTLVLLSRLRAPLRATQAMTVASERGGLQDPIIISAHSPATVDASWVTALGFRVSSVGRLAVVEVAALVFATLGYVGIGWAAGLTTFCAYNKYSFGNPHLASVHWQECYQFSRGWHSEGQHSHSGLPTTYFGLLLTSLIITVLGPFLWFVLWKVVRQSLRPTRVNEKTDDGLRELPQTAMFALAAMVGMIAGAGASEHLPRPLLRHPPIPFCAAAIRARLLCSCLLSGSARPLPCASP